MARLDPIESLVEYVEEVKPYHTKVIDVLVEYVYEDTINATITERLEFDIQIDFDRYNRICMEGFGFPGLGKKLDGEMPLNPLYDPTSPNYRPELDRNSEFYDPTAYTSSPIPTQAEKDVSMVYQEYGGSPLNESNWDNFDCGAQQESLIQTNIAESLGLDIARECSFDSDWYITVDREQFYEYNLDNRQAVQDNFISMESPSPSEGRTYANIVIDGSDGGKLYWEYLLDTVSVFDADTFSVGIGSYDDTLNPPFEVPAEQKQRVGFDANSYGYLASGNFLNNNTTSGSPATLASSDVVGVALDLDGGTVEFFKNNVSQGTIAISTVGITFSPVISMELGNSGSAVTIQVGLDLTYSPPSGFEALACPASSPGSP